MSDKLLMSLLYVGDFLISFSVGVLIIVHFNFDWEYNSIEQYTKKSLIQQPMIYFNVDNGTNQIANQHIFSYWEGMNSIQKCWCEKYNKEKHYCEYRKCQTVVDRVAGFNLPIWKNTSFVSQNSIYHNYFTLLKNAKPYRESCDEGHKPCGLLDSFNQTLCLLENETCPLNQIELSNSSTPSDIFTNKSAVNTTLLNDNITYLHTSNAEINSHIIIEVVFGPKSFCFYFNRRKLGPPDYWYEISSTSGKCTNYFGYEIDYNYISLDKYSKFNVYNENGIIPIIQGYLEYSEPYPLEELHKIQFTFIQT